MSSASCFKFNVNISEPDVFTHFRHRACVSDVACIINLYPQFNTIIINRTVCNFA